MNPRAEEQIVQLLERVNQGADFAIEHTPEAIQQMIMLHKIYCVTGLVLAILSISAIVFVAVKGWKDCWQPEGVVLLCILSLFMAIGGIIITIEYISAWIAPQYHIIKTLIG
jgi:hypothetical protein